MQQLPPEQAQYLPATFNQTKAKQKPNQHNLQTPKKPREIALTTYFEA